MSTETAKFSDLQALLAFFREVLRKEHELRQQRNNLSWINLELRAMQTAVNAERLKRGYRPVSLNVILKTEMPARGHSDYAYKFSLYCAELALSPFAPEDYVFASASNLEGKVLRITDVWVNEAKAAVETQEAACNDNPTFRSRTILPFDALRPLSDSDTEVYKDAINKFPTVKEYSPI